MSGKALEELDPEDKGLKSSLSTATLVIDVDEQDDLSEPLYEQLTSTPIPPNTVYYFFLYFHEYFYMFILMSQVGEIELGTTKKC